MKIEITENTVVVDGTIYNKEDSLHLPTVTDLFEKWNGVTLDTEEGKKIQKWYYGTFVNASWCATSMSYMLANLGLLRLSCGKRYENVFYMSNALKEHCMEVETLQKGDIVVFCWDKDFTPTSSKHITSYAGDRKFIGGNQDGAIKYKEYDYSKIVHIFRPSYQLGTLKNISSFPII